MGEMLAFMAAVGYAAQLILIKKGCKDKSASGSISIQLFVLSSAILMILALYAAETAAIGRSTFFSQLLRVPREAVIFIVLDGLLGSLAGLYLLTMATELIGPSRTSVLRGTNPIFAAILASVLLKENPGLLGIIGLGLLVSGIVVISWNKDSEPFRESDKPRLLGNGLAILSGLSFALSQTSRGMALDFGASPEIIVFWGLVTSFTVLFVIHYFIKDSFNFSKGIDLKTAKYYIYAGASLIVGSYALSLSFVYIDVWKAVAIRNMQPIPAMVMSWFFLKQQELITTRLVAGALLVIAAIWVFAVI